MGVDCSHALLPEPNWPAPPQSCADAAGVASAVDTPITVAAPATRAATRCRPFRPATRGVTGKAERGIAVPLHRGSQGVASAFRCQGHLRHRGKWGTEGSQGRMGSPRLGRGDARSVARAQSCAAVLNRGAGGRCGARLDAGPIARTGPAAAVLDGRAGCPGRCGARLDAGPIARTELPVAAVLRYCDNLSDGRCGWTGECDQHAGHGGYPGDEGGHSLPSPSPGNRGGRRRSRRRHSSTSRRGRVKRAGEGSSHAQALLI